MDLELFPFQVFDIANGASVSVTRLSTREFIAKAKGKPIEDGGRAVDERLVDGDGRAIIDPATDEARLLRELADRGGHASISGNQDRHSMRELETLRLVTHYCPSGDRVDYDISDLGRLAVTQLL